MVRPRPAPQRRDLRDAPRGTALTTAEGWARATGQPGICTVTQGPGLSQLATPARPAVLQLGLPSRFCRACAVLDLATLQADFQPSIPVQLDLRAIGASLDEVAGPITR